MPRTLKDTKLRAWKVTITGVIVTRDEHEAHVSDPVICFNTQAAMLEAMGEVEVQAVPLVEDEQEEQS
jgi:ribosome-binding factor A